MGKITKYLNQLIVGNVFDDPEILEAYATDRSALRVKPKFVAFPESTEDIRKLMRFFNQIAAKEIPVSLTPRGSGLDEGGADLSSGLVVSMEKLNHLLEIDPRDRLVRVQAGITLKELNTALSVSGLTLPIGGHDYETIGGLIANSTADLYQDKYGGIGKFVERVEVVLSNGECLQTARFKKYALAKKTAEKSFEGSVYRKIVKLIKNNERLINSLDLKEVGLAGYPNIQKVQRRETVDLMPLFLGSQGTLGIISEVILRVVPQRTKPLRFAVTARNIDALTCFLDMISPLKPREINLFDLKIIQEARESGKNLDGIIRKIDNGYVAYVTFDEYKKIIARRLNRIKEKAPRTVRIMFDTPENELALNELENSLATYLNRPKNGERVPILTDFYLPSINLASFLNDLKVLEDKLGLNLELFGSYSSEIYSLRPKFDCTKEGYNKKLATFLRAGAYVIERQDGVLTGGTPEGRLKAVVVNPAMSDSQRKLYERIKKIFDPNSILNPDVKLGSTSKFSLTHLRDTELKKISV
ncbi:FAD-binding oxidoreductase [Candidatus Saccharibacteria bacterium]|nr:FAD-binding oxidoreductase [Candidatus Saccharibacteria bacterium]